MSSATQDAYVHDSWQGARNARTLRAFMVLRNEEIAARIRELRGTKPQTLVADEMGVAERTYQNWELGETKPSYRSLQLLAGYFGVPEEFILTGGRRDLSTRSPANEPATPDLSLAKTETSALEVRLERVEDTLQEVRRTVEDLYGQREGFLQLLADQQRVLEGIAAHLGDDALSNRADKAVEASIERARVGLAASQARASQAAAPGPAAAAGTRRPRHKSKA